MRLLLLILVAGAVTGGTHAQFRANSQRTRFNSDEFDNDFDDLFDRRSRERNSLERDSFERFTFGRTTTNNNNNNNNNNVVFRDSLETDSFEIRRPFTSNRNANNNNFVLVRDSLERDSIEIRRSFGTSLNTNNQRVNNNNNFRSFRRDSPETNSFEIQIPLRNVPQSILNQNLAAPGFRRGSFESVEIRNPFLSAPRSNNNNNRNTNANNHFGLRRDSDERDNSVEVRIPINNLRSGVTGNTVNNQGSRLGGFRTVSIETDSFEIVNPFGGPRRQQNPSVSAAPRPIARPPAGFFRDSPEDISLEVVLANPFQNSATLSGQQPNRNTGAAPGRPASHFGGRGSVLRFDSFEHNSLERDSVEDLIEDLTDDDADDRARARLTLQRLGRLPGGTATPSSLSGAVNNNSFGRPLSATNSRTNPFGRPVTTTSAPARAANNNVNSNPFGFSTIANSANPFGRPLTLNNNNNNANTRTVLNQEVTDQLNAIIAANRIPITSSRLSNNNNNNNFGRPLPISNTNLASNSGTNNQGSTFSSARFPPLPVSPFTRGLRTNSRINSNTIATTSNFNNNNNNRFNLNDNRFNLNNNPFLSRTLSNQNQNQQPRSQATTTSTTTPRPVRPVTPLPSPSRRPLPPSTPAPTTRRPAPRTTTVRPTPEPQRHSSSSGSGSSFGSGTPNPFQTAARLNNIVRSESDKPPANPFINPGPQSKKSGSSSSSSTSSKNKPGNILRKSIPVVVPMGFEWPGGNGYYFRMSTGNSKPIQYFISYDD